MYLKTADHLNSILLMLGKLKLQVQDFGNFEPTPIFSCQYMLEGSLSCHVKIHFIVLKPALLSYIEHGKLTVSRFHLLSAISPALCSFSTLVSC